MNYHLMIDEKFIDKFIESAEIVAPGKNFFIITATFPGTFVKSPKGIFALPFSDEFNKIIAGIKEDDRLFIHWFENYLIEVLNNVCEQTPVYLFFWGGDLLGQTPSHLEFNLDQLAKKYLSISEKKMLLYFPRNPIWYLKNIKRYFDRQRLKMIKQGAEILARIKLLERLNYFCHWNKLDLERVIEAYGGSPIFLDFVYDVGLGKIQQSIESKKSLGSTINIWLGNSDQITNNHLDAIQVLKKFKSENIKIYCPLNYDYGEYGKYVSNKGIKYFARKWEDFTEFMPLAEYLQLLNSADIVVMYHNVTQAAGNIFSFIRMGKKVFVKKQSTIFSLMQENGIKIFDANTIEKMTFEEFMEPLSADEVSMNFLKISDMFSDDRRLLNLRSILN